MFILFGTEVDWAICSFSKSQQQPGLNHTKSRNLELSLVLHVDAQNPAASLWKGTHKQEARLRASYPYVLCGIPKQQLNAVFKQWFTCSFESQHHRDIQRNRDLSSIVQWPRQPVLHQAKAGSHMLGASSKSLRLLSRAGLEVEQSEHKLIPEWEWWHCGVQLNPLPQP